VGATPPRGFPRSEFEARTGRAQRLMAARGLDALLLTTEPEVRYFSGFLSQFWESPTRPWFLIVPRDGPPIAVIPEIGAAGMAETWVEDIRTWPAADYGRLVERLGNLEVADATGIVRLLRDVKSPLEIDKIRYLCQLTSDAFEALPAAARRGESEREVCRKLQLDLLRRGADATPYLIGASGPGGYDNIIMGPTDRVLGAGDVLIIDTGATFDGYFCDFDRNFAFGPPDEAARRAHEVAYNATEAGIDAARPGATHQDLWAAMWKVLEQGGALGETVGRLGHGLGMQLTEGPSHRPGDDTPLEPGMVITIEPGMVFAPGKLMVHEENIAITGGAPELLTRRAPPEIPVISRTGGFYEPRIVV